jgi:hypothetical protein
LLEKAGFNKNGSMTKLGMIHAAYLFTVERKEQIAEIKEEITLIDSYISGQKKALDIPYELPTPKQQFRDHIVVFQRILAVEQQRLADLRKGMK